MTNGEKFKEVFGFGADGSRVIAVNATWWDCEFQNRKSVTKKEKEGNMSVIVKDMRFPTYCFDCEFSRPRGNDATYCSRHPERESVKYGEGKPEWCPIADVPTPHGDLIDKKNLSDDLQRRWNVSDDQDFCNKEVWHALEEAPTIIEAEE